MDLKLGFNRMAIANTSGEYCRLLKNRREKLEEAIRWNMDKRESVNLVIPINRAKFLSP